MRVLFSEFPQRLEDISSGRGRTQSDLLKDIILGGNAVRTVLAEVASSGVSPLHVERVVVSLKSQLVGSGDSHVISKFIKCELGLNCESAKHKHRTASLISSL